MVFHVVYQCLKGGREIVFYGEAGVLDENADFRRKTSINPSFLNKLCTRLCFLVYKSTVNLLQKFHIHQSNSTAVLSSALTLIFSCQGFFGEAYTLPVLLYPRGACRLCEKCRCFDYSIDSSRWVMRQSSRR